MKQVIKEAMGDCSTIGEFRFLLRCQECGRTWHSSPVRFSKAGTEPETEGMRAVFRTLYERERAAARENRTVRGPGDRRRGRPCARTGMGDGAV